MINTTYQTQGESKATFDNWPPGIFIAVVYMENDVTGQCKLIIAE